MKEKTESERRIKDQKQANIMEEWKANEKQAKLKQEEDLDKTLKEAEKLFNTFVLDFKLNLQTLALKINNDTNDEVMIIKYGNEEVIVDIDLVFKERTHVKVLGLEIESKHGFSVFNRLIRSMLRSLEDIKEMLDPATEEV